MIKLWQKKKNEMLQVKYVLQAYADSDGHDKTARDHGIHITKTCLYNTDPLKTHFYIVKLGFTGVYIIFLIPAQKHRLWVLVRTASSRRF